MKKSVLKPTPENIFSTFVNDSVGRNNDLLYFINILDSIDESFSIALDSYWGTGKTFFVKQVKMILDAYNDNSYDHLDKTQRNKVKEEWKKLSKNSTEELQSGFHIPIYYDAWKNDNDNDPIISLVFQMLKTTNAYIPQENQLKELAELASIIIDKALQINPFEIIKAIKADNPFSEISKTKSLKESIEEFIDDLIPEHGERLLIIIDELDRCNPKFAVTLLERIKHYFDNDRVTFVFSLNLIELDNTIRCFYGNEFNASRYLDRFFDLTIALPKPDMKRFYESIEYYSTLSVHDRILQEVIKKYNMPLRECSKYLSICKAMNINLNKLNNDYYSPETNTRRIVFDFIVPVVLGTMIQNTYLYNRFIQENDCSLFGYYLDDETIESNKYTIGALFTKDELSNNLLSELSIKNKDEIITRLKKLCEKLRSGEGSAMCYDCYITNSDRRLFKQSITLLSKSLSESSE